MALCCQYFYFFYFLKAECDSSGLRRNFGIGFYNLGTIFLSHFLKEPLFSFRSKRKVLGRKEPSDSFGSRQSLVSPVKHSSSGGDLRNLTLGSSQRSSSRNENFMALLQKKGSKSSSGGARVSAMELLKSTNPLARRVTEFSTTTVPTAEGGETPSGGDKPGDQ